MINFKNIGSIVAGILVGICLLGIVMPQTTLAKTTDEVKKTVKTIKVVITAYSSSPEETDDTPFITASGKTVRDGIIANNLLPIGTKVKIPKLFGNKIFVVEDRMNKRMGNHRFDIWFPSKDLALNFGVKTAELIVLEN